MSDVYVLWHTHVFDDGEEDDKLIGIYSTADAAENARQRVAALPGFIDHPEGFLIDRYPLDQDHWSEGVFTFKPDRT